MTFATLAELKSRWPEMSASQEFQASVLIGDASSIIGALCAKAGISLDDPDEVLTANLRTVTCSVVKRAMCNTDLMGVSQQSQGAGSYTESVSFSNPMGDLYLTRHEKSLLGITGQRMAWLNKAES